MSNTLFNELGSLLESLKNILPFIQNKDEKDLILIHIDTCNEIILEQKNFSKKYLEFLKEIEALYKG